MLSIREQLTDSSTVGDHNFGPFLCRTDDGTESSSSSSTSLPSRTPASITSASMTPAHSKWSKVDIGAVVGGSAALVLVLGATAGILLYRRRGHNETRAAGESFIPDISIHGSTAHLGPCQQDQHWRNASNEQSAAFLSPNLNPTSSESFNSESEGSSSHAPLFVGRLLHQSSTPGTLPPTQHRTSLPSVDYRNSGTFISPGRRRTLQRGAEELRPPDYHSVVQRS
ncbi:hypothetical protein NEOLEDRAFT_1230847 [Neolentinus lepideus HHB14362 ss-1]|uniref:Uncharacterized protein n=1 Tax=Neolentinus lepideus HHB14362 ss-1 TaxID=1314782 RepID=A0A165UIJ7_9AGAM|nr:hypothetical protein NEOLEDRAFT_1230847 [Neolentinus lepideus HHB14362 ss-1]